MAIQDLWLAATAAGLGVGWPSFYREEFLRDLLRLPSRIQPVAWLCLGPVMHLETFRIWSALAGASFAGGPS